MVEKKFSREDRTGAIVIAAIIFTYLFWSMIGFFPIIIFIAFIVILFLKSKQFSQNIKIDKNDILITLLVSVIFSALFYYSLMQGINSGKWTFPGMSIFIWEVFFLGGSYYIMNSAVKNRPSLYSITLASVAVVLSAWYIIYTQHLFAISNFILLLIVNALYLASFHRENFSIGSAVSALKSYFSSSLYSIGTLCLLKSTTEIKKSFSLLRLFGPILILVILLAVIFPLLLSADSVFKKIISDILEKISLDISLFIDLGFIVFMSVFVLSFFLFHKYEKQAYSSHSFSLKIPSADKYYEYVILGGVSAVYLLFVFVQFKYLFFGTHDMFQALDLRYADYVHQGFYQLIAIGGINFILLWIFARDTQGLFSAKSGVSKGLYISIIILTLCMIYSAFMRIGLYIEAYHLTILRFFVGYIIILLLGFYALLFISTFKEVKYIFNGFFIFIFFSFLAIGYSNLDAQVAQYNINRAENFDDIDAKYILVNLSRDAIQQKKEVLKNLDLNILQSYVYGFVIEDIQGYSASINSKGYYYNYFMNQYLTDLNEE